MAHQITIREDQTPEFCFTGSRQKIWHGLGAEMEDGASIEAWKKAAGMDWEALPSPVTYSAITSEGVKEMTYPDKKILFRSDNFKPLSVVSDSYKVVQPGEVLEFFNDVSLQNKMKLSAAGTIFEGRRFWATAETFKNAEILPGDAIKGFLLFTTSVDGSSASVAKFVSERAVCNNTLTVALAERATSGIFKKSHRSVWDSKEAKMDLGLIDETWDSFIMNLKMLSSVEIKDDKAMKFFQDSVFDKSVAEEDQKATNIKKVDTLMNLYKNGAGASLSYGSAWGVLNAVTEICTHGSGRKSESHQFWDAMHGGADEFKTLTLEKLVAEYA